MLCHSSRKSSYLISCTAFALLLLLVVYPAFTVLLESLRPSGVWGLASYGRLFEGPRFASIIGSSMGVALAGGLAASLLGGTLAVIVIKTNAPFRRLMGVAALLPIILPGFVSSIAYIFLFGRNGLVTYQWLGISWDVYSWKSVLVLQVVDQSTTAFLLGVAALRNIDPALEEVAGSLGAGSWRILRTITFALASPLGVAAFLLNVMHSMSDFGTPLVVGGPFDTLASASYTQLIGKYDASMASTLNMTLLAFCLLAYAGYALLESRFGRTQVMDQSKPVKRLPLGGWPGRAVWFLCMVFCLFMLALLASVLLAAFTKRMGGDYAPTLMYFESVATRGFESARNTLLFSLMVGFLAALGGQVLAYLVKRMRIPGAGALDIMATLPFAVPGTFIGVGYALAFNRPPLVLTGTWAIIVLNLVIRKLPMGLRAGASVLARQDRAQEEASLSLGASMLRTFFRVILPSVRTAMLAGGLYAFVSAVQSLGSIIFIITPGTRLLSVDVFEAVVRGDVGQAAALSVIMLAMAGFGAACFAAATTMNRKSNEAIRTPADILGQR
ncbi:MULTISPECIES: iron ABC transporter permease [unclassified Pseudodesulfovibrio]|uniref:ABC transporter permease n=1 Tax=unclassified Pseudodesulfovibrio TaxID=2661612 RepID=UPI000FEC00C0|nr:MULTISPECIES: iron ABC transporter permease [unclassified Pseudodesulfovibrio]MCJ2163622.1 iron ABC transporter permease [Pseudodesulfovibrio sp. S3-i]RWU06852.1 iron ABC transporter permease [Pseudodesulfovibrio sp. S3]